MVWRLARLTFDVDSTEANRHLLAVIGQQTNFNFGADCFSGCGVEGLKDCVCAWTATHAGTVLVLELTLTLQYYTLSLYELSECFLVS